MKTLAVVVLTFLLIAMLYGIRGLLDYIETMSGETPDIKSIREHICKAKLRR